MKILNDSVTNTEDMIKNFITMNAVPLLMEYSAEVQPVLSSLPIKKHVLIFYEPTDNDNSNDFLLGVESVATKFKGRFVKYFMNFCCISITLTT